MAKFKIVKMHSFRIGGKRYAKGETIELSEEDAERLKDADFVEPIKEEKRRKSREKAKAQINSLLFPLAVKNQCFHGA